ncbi:hypothetical protein K1719_019476 [Acacia pycnantha]|nr:hypothetical protein K1719_019476 [Acacia pycnantha]
MGILEDSVSLKNLSHLEIDVVGFINGKDFINYFLERLPNLETLTLVNYPNVYLKKESFEDNFKGALAYCSQYGLRRTKGLKKVIIKEFNHDIVFLLGLLMKSCTELEEIMLHYPSSYNKFMMTVGFQYLQRFETASPEPPSFHFFPRMRRPGAFFSSAAICSAWLRESLFSSAFSIQFGTPCVRGKPYNINQWKVVYLMTLFFTYSLSFPSRTYSGSESCLQCSITKPYVLPFLPSASLIIVLITALANNDWIIRLFRDFHIHELSLDYKLRSFFSMLLPSFAEFESLKVLKISMEQFNTAVKQLPKMKLASLETLHIKWIGADASFPKWISESFPSLKHLFLQKIIYCKGEEDFIIESSSLKYLAISHCSWFLFLRLLTPNLHTLNCCFGKYSWSRLQSSSHSLQSLTWVHGADRNRLHHDEEVFQNLQITTTIPRLVIMGVSYDCVLAPLLDTMRSARELHIDTEVLQEFKMKRVFQDYYGERLVKNLRHLEIHVQKCIDGRNYITFLERSSNLETLTLVDSQNDGSDYDSNPFLKERSVVDNFKKALRRCRKNKVRRTKGLKKVKLITKEFKYRIVLVIGWLIKSCEDLEEVSLNYPYCFHRFMMRDGLQHLQSFPRASHQPPSFYFLPKRSAKDQPTPILIAEEDQKKKALIEELDKLVERLRVPSEYATCLTGGSFDEARMIQNVEAYE